MEHLQHLAEGTRASPEFYFSLNLINIRWEQTVIVCMLILVYVERWRVEVMSVGVCGFRVWTLCLGSKERRGLWDFLDPE